MKILAALLVCFVALAGGIISPVTAAAPVLPWTTFSGEMVADVIPGQMGFGQCGPQRTEIFLAMFQRDHMVVLMVFASESGRIAFVYGEGSDPIYVGFGQINPDKHDEIPPLYWMPFVKAVHNNPCDLIRDNQV